LPTWEDSGFSDHFPSVPGACRGENQVRDQPPPISREGVSFLAHTACEGDAGLSGSFQRDTRVGLAGVGEQLAMRELDIQEALLPSLNPQTELLRFEIVQEVRRLMYNHIAVRVTVVKGGQTDMRERPEHTPSRLGFCRPGVIP